MTNFYNSGLYTTPFYKKTSNLIFDQDFLSDTLSSNYDVFFKYYSYKIEEIGQGESEVARQIMDLLLDKISGELLCFEPLKFNIEIALKCGLIPLVAPDIKINNNQLLRSCHSFLNIVILSSDLEARIMDLSPRLDAYQALTDYSIDEASYLFSDPESFESVLGKTLTKQVLDAVS